ncbi:MAG: MqnA/MqnD/SBP family protein [Planctomycetota bacterium]
MSLRFAFSPCPNDTFAFHAWVHGLVPGPELETTLLDIEELNVLAEGGGADVVKVSVAAYGRLRETHFLLRTGGAAGYGTGPIVVGREGQALGGRIAIPGERTTAALLLGLLGSFDTVAMRFDRIEAAVAAGEVDCGVLIHEGRFTFEQKGLALLCDLGAEWESRFGLPVPLGGVAVRRDLQADAAREIESVIGESVRYARAHPDASREYVAAHAQEMDAVVQRRHIELYVNDYTLALDEHAVAALLRHGEDQHAFAKSAAPIFP